MIAPREGVTASMAEILVEVEPASGLFHNTSLRLKLEHRS